MNCRLETVLRIFRLNFIIQVMNKILQSDMFTKTWMWNGRILYFVALNIAMNLSDHLCSAKASTNGEFHLHNAKRKQYSSILHSLPLSYETAIFWIYTLKKFNLKIRQSMLRAAEIKDETPTDILLKLMNRKVWNTLNLSLFYRHSSHNQSFIT